MELKNLSGESDFFLENWQLIGKKIGSAKNSIEIIFEKENKIEDFFLLERTDDSSVSDISADKVYAGALNNSDFVLRLFDENCNLIDEVLVKTKWPGGNNETKETMERTEDLEWQTSSEPGGTPRDED
jgi:hypothetical protein